MNVFVVDDEPIIRQVLRTMIRWEEHGLTWGGEAVDGEEAWEMLQQGSYDLVVTDILMPRMDGLELVKRLKQSEADVAIVVLSCLDDFGYVKEAMKQGASDYILKPTMEPEQLVDILTEAKLALLRRREERSQREELQLRLQQSQQARLGIRLQQVWLSGQVDAELETELFLGGAQLSSWMIYVIPSVGMSLSVWQWPDALAVVSISEQQQLLLFTEKEEDRGSAAQAEQINSFLTDTIGLEEGSFCMTVTSGIRASEQLGTIIREHESLRHSLFYREGTGAAKVIMEPSEPLLIKPEWDGSLPQEEKHNVLRAIAGHNEEAVAYWSKQVIVRIEEKQPPVDQVYHFIYELLGLTAAFARQHGATAESMDEFERRYVSLSSVQSSLDMAALGRWFAEGLVELATLLTGAGAAAFTSSSNQFVRKAVDYMKNHYHLPISTLDISKNVKLSRSYLSDLYGKETGESLSETLMRIRINAAKRLLETGGKKVYEIADVVGFCDAKAFAKAFKKVVGCTPKEYEEQNK